MEKKEEFLIEIRDALARGYCTKENEKKVLDFDLIYAMGNEIEVLISQELDKAREEGREEGINAVLFPKFKRDKNGTLKREGWVDTSKLEDK